MHCSESVAFFSKASARFYEGGCSLIQPGSDSPYNCKCWHIVEYIDVLYKSQDVQDKQEPVITCPKIFGRLKSEMNVYRRKMNNLLNDFMSEARPSVRRCLLTEVIYPSSRSPSYYAHSERTFCGYAQPFLLRSRMTK